MMMMMMVVVVTRMMRIDDNGGYPAYSHHDRFPPWWVFVRDDYGGNLSGDKIPP